MKTSKIIRKAIVISGIFLILFCINSQAQIDWAVLEAPPTGAAPAGDVLRTGHLGREVGNIELIEYKDHLKNFVHPHIQDPGTVHVLFISRDADIVMPPMKSAGLHTLSTSNSPVFIGPVTRSLFVANPDGFWAEFMDNGVKKKP